MTDLAADLNPLQEPAAPVDHSAAAPLPENLQPDQVQLLDPQGNLVKGPSALMPNALRLGYKLATPENLEEAAKQKKYGEGVGNELKAAALGAGEGATFGLSTAALRAAGVDPETMAEIEKRSPVAHGLGTAAGVVGSALLAPELSPVGLAGKAGRAVEGAVASTADGALGYASRLGAHALGSAVEGAMYGGGQSVTEAALGDPDLNGEHVLANVGFGALIGGAGGTLFKGVADAGKAVLGGGEGVLSGLGMKAGRIIAGTPEEDAAYYVQNAERVNQAPEREAIKDSLDQAVEREGERLQAAKEASRQADQELVDGYRGAKLDLKGQKPDLDLVDDLHDEMNNQKAVLGSLSEQMDDALERSGVSVPKTRIEGMIDRQLEKLTVGGRGGLGDEAADDLADHLGVDPDSPDFQRQIENNGAVIGQQNKATAAYLTSIKADLQAMPDTLTGKELRTIIRGLRADAQGAYELGAGEFAAAKGRAAQNIAESLNPVVKNASTETEAILGRMRELTSNLKDLNKHFATPERALNSLDLAASGSAKGEIRKSALDRFDELTGKDFGQRLQPFQKTKELLTKAARGDASAEIVPELVQKAQAAKKVLEEAQASYEPIKRLSSTRTQSIIKNQGFKNASIEDRRALEELSRRSGRDFIQDIRDRNVLDSFGKEHTHGSRLVNAGGIAGYIFGGKIGAVIGDAAGLALDKYGSKVYKRVLDGVALARQTNKAVDDKLGQMMLDRLGPKVLESMKPAAIAATLQELQRLRANDPHEEARGAGLAQVEKLVNKSSNSTSMGTRAVFGSGATGHWSDIKPLGVGDYMKLKSRLNHLSMNPDDMIDHVTSATQPVHNVAPDTAQALNTATARAVTFLKSKLPDNAPLSPLDGDEPQPSKAEAAHFGRYLQVVENPHGVLGRVKDGTLSGEDVETLQAVYPKLYQSMQETVMNHLAGVKNPSSVPYRTKVALSQFVGSPLVTSMTPGYISAVQQAMSGQTANQVAKGQPSDGARRPNQTGLAKMTVSQRMMTDDQQSASRRLES